MKKEIHPQYKTTTITCACGAVLEVGSTQENIEVEICSQCHPFYTGKKKVVDTAGRVDRFKHIAKKAREKQIEKKKIQQARQKRKKENLKKANQTKKKKKQKQ